MATVTKCDRCGQYIDCISDSLPHITHRKNSGFNTAVKHLDICPECYRHFLEWVKPFDEVDCETDDGE